MNSELEDSEYLKIFDVMGSLMKSISEKIPEKYLSVERINPNNNSLIEAHLLLKNKEEPKQNLLSKIFGSLWPLQSQLDHNRTLVTINQAYNKDYEIKNYISFIDENYPYLKEICEDLRRDYAVF